jgi:hypothetical protein
MPSGSLVSGRQIGHSEPSLQTSESTWTLRARVAHWLKPAAKAAICFLP